jgi:hypothetical protein
MRDRAAKRRQQKANEEAREWLHREALRFSSSSPEPQKSSQPAPKGKGKGKGKRSKPASKESSPEPSYKGKGKGPGKKSSTYYIKFVIDVNMLFFFHNILR